MQHVTTPPPASASLPSNAYHARAWLAWLLAGSFIAMVTRNPYYLIILLLAARLANRTCVPRTGTAVRLPFWSMSVVILMFSSLFNALTAHFGRTILLELPAGWWLIGGPLTAEALVYGLITGLSLITLLAFFLTFNAAVTAGELARLVPSALKDLGIVLIVAITYVPETIRQLGKIRDAQAVRGHQLQGLRSWRPIVTPLVVGGLECAVNLAESMVARGYGSTSVARQPGLVRLLLVAATGHGIIGAVRLVMAQEDGWLGVLGAVLLLAIAYFGLSRREAHTRYRNQPWTRRDSLVVAGALLPLLFLGAHAVGGASPVGNYQPYPQLALPEFSLPYALSLLGLAVPTLLELAE